MVLVNFVLPNSTADDITGVYGKLDELEPVVFEPVGRWYESYCSRCYHKHSLSTSSQSSSSEEETEDSDLIEDNSSVLLTLDPKNWKDQDHYEVLGIGKLRFQATEDQIKRAYKKKVLQHHPDKRKARGIPVKQGEEDYFPCVTKAYEILGNPSKKRSYDSIDPEFDDSIPDNNADSKQNFYKLFVPVFERNARWSVNNKKMLSIGDETTPYEDVDRFYDFWYNFESWREYSYLDEEEKEKGDNRDERRWIEKQNRASRVKRKKEEMQRIRQLVDNAYACDPRIIKYRTDEKERKLAVKQAKQDAIRFKAEEEERKRQEVIDAERLAKEKQEEEIKAQQAVQRKEKESQKKNMKKEKKRLRTYAKDFDFLAKNEEEKIQNMQDLEKLLESCSIECLAQINKAGASGDKEMFSEAFKAELNNLNQKIEDDKKEHMDSVTKKCKTEAESNTTSNDGGWSELEIQTLIKAVNLFPAGTNARWETITNFLKLHVPDFNKNEKEALSKAKNLQKNDIALKEDANKKAFEKFAKESKPIPAAAVIQDKDVSERYESAAEVQLYDIGSNPAPWAPDEQKLLEQAMRTYPSTVTDRWDKIAECIPMRTKKDCMKRYKELVELIRTKKLAQAAANKK